MKVTILGCGPAGLLAAQGAADAGAEVSIVSKKAQSPIAGAQYIHAPIPGLRIKPSEVVIVKRGTAEGYSKKVYGVPDIATSWDSYEDGDRLACWPMKEIYERLWKRWAGKIEDRAVDQELLNELGQNGAGMVISTIPAPVLCREPHEHRFEATEIIVTVNNGVNVNRNSIIYNGNLGIRWVRASFLFGCLSIEYGVLRTRPGQMNAPYHGILIKKPQRTNCDCHPEILRAGRYGKWQRGILAHSAYEEVHSAVLEVS